MKNKKKKNAEHSSWPKARDLLFSIILFVTYLPPNIDPIVILPPIVPFIAPPCIIMDLNSIASLIEKHTLGVITLRFVIDPGAIID